MTRNDLINKFNCVTGLGAEIGVYEGEFAREILNRYTGKLLCVDRWSGETVGLGPQNWVSVYAKYAEVEDRFNGRVITKIGYSTSIANHVDDSSLDFVYIDADHQYEAVKADIESWFPKVRSGGIVSGHDYLRGGFPLDPEQGVNGAVDEFFGRIGLKVNLTDEDKWLSWWVVK